MNHLSRAREVFDIEIAALKAVRAQLDAIDALAVPVSPIAAKPAPEPEPEPGPAP